MSAAWTTVPLGEVLAPVVRERQVDPSQEYPLLGVRLDGQGPFHRETVLGAQTSASRLYEVKAGDFIYSRLFAWRGAFGLIEAELDGHFVSNEFPTFAPSDGRIEPKYLRYWFRLPDVLRRVEADCSGSTPLTRNRYKEQFFCALKVPLPPIAEQRRIVARIEELAARLEEAKQLRLEAQLECNVVFARILDAHFKAESTGWMAATVNDVAESLDAGWSPQCEDTPATDGQWGVLKTTSVQWCEFRSHENKRLPVSVAPRPELAVKAGDVLVTRAGPMKRVGVPATVRTSHPKLMISDKLIRIRPDLSRISPRFLEYALSSPQAQEHLVARKTGLADAQVNISQAILRATPFSYPSLAEQARVIGELDALQAKINAVKALQEETAAELDAMLPAVLDKAFKGEL